MKRTTPWQKVIKLATAVAVGGSAFQMSGCDPAVRDTVLVGLESTTSTLTQTLISAFFISLDDEGATSQGLTTT